MAVNVILRYVFGKPIKGTVELEEFILVVVVFLGLSYTAVQKRHVRIDFLVSQFSDSLQSVINSITSVMSLGLCSIMIGRGALYAQSNLAHKTTSVLLDMPVYLFIYLLLGCVMNILPAVIVTLPIFFPTILNLGFDPIWFGVVLVIIMEMGLITPPVGMNVFVIKGVAKDVTIGKIYIGIVPFLFAMVACVIILTLFPKIALFLPSAMGN